MYIVRIHVCMFTWEGEAEKGSQEKVWPGGGWSPVMGRTRLGRMVYLWASENERGSQFGNEMACVWASTASIFRPGCYSLGFGGSREGFRCKRRLCEGWCGMLLAAVVLLGD